MTTTTTNPHYLAVAERWGVEQWATDARLARAVSGELPWVRLAADALPA